MSYDLSRCVVDEHVSIKEALKRVDENHYGFIFLSNEDGKIVGLATDGDIRRALIGGAIIDDPIFTCANKDFLSADVSTAREKLIKQLDSHIKFIPILDKEGKLKSVISKDYLPLGDEKATYIRSRAPVRISFGGGGSDLTHYFANSAGAVINAAVSIYSHGVMRVRNDSRIIINSLDLNARLTASDLEDALSQVGTFGLVQSLLHVVQPKYGFEMCINSDFPVGSGLGGSATLSAVVLGCFNMVRQDPWNQYELAEIAFQAERLHLGVAGGWQDQYAAVFGGFNFIEFHSEENIVNPIRVHPDIALELEESLVLCDTGIAHQSGNIHENQREAMASSVVQKMVKANVDLSYETRNYLLKGELDKFGECLDKAWRLKRNFSSMISNEYLDEVYEGALQNGALGGKLLGAGGGGFFIFYAPPFRKHSLIRYLRSRNLSVKPFRFEPNGLKTWKSREEPDRALSEGEI